jgi:predicted dienelactone hydrolase
VKIRHTALGSIALGFIVGAAMAAAPAAAPPAAEGSGAPVPPSRFGVDAPELAPLGGYAVGVRTLHLCQTAQVDVLAFDPVKGAAPLRDRELGVELWYPARPNAPGRPVVYQGELPSEPPAPPAHFTVPGIALRDAPRAAARFPLIVVSHGYSNDPVAMTWLTENLASKGYVVAAIRHEDPPISDPRKYAEPLLRRPLDIVYVVRTLQRTLAEEGLIDPGRIALIGYSMGGYGVLTAGGATLDPEGPPAKLIPGGLLLPYARGGALESQAVLTGLRAVVAISPAGTVNVWGAEGLAALTAPLLIISGNEDHRLNYATHARAIFDNAVNARRYLLTLKGAGHNIGLNPAPAEMRARLWDQDWFEDPVWRKERITAIDAHFITAFLDRHVKGDESRAAYLEVPTAESDAGEWAAPASTAYAAMSPGGVGITLWKGFHRDHAVGLELLLAYPAEPAKSP